MEGEVGSTLKTEEKAMIQGIQEASKNWKEQRNKLSSGA